MFSIAFFIDFLALSATADKAYFLGWICNEKELV